MLSPSGQPPGPSGDEDENEDVVALNEEDYGITNNFDEIELDAKDEVADPFRPFKRRRNTPSAR